MAHHAAVLHDEDAVGEVENVVDVVADQEDADAVLLQLLACDRLHVTTLEGALHDIGIQA